MQPSFSRPGRNAGWVLALILSGLTAFAVPFETASEEGLQRLQLIDGSWVDGLFSVQREGMFLHTQTGGKLYRWEELQPGSLQPDLRGRVRVSVLNLANQADALYRGGRADLAQPLYRKLYLLAWYLRYDDWQQPAFENFRHRLSGLVWHDGAWVTYAAQQQALGRVLVDGRWLTPAQVTELQAFKAAFKAAREAVDETHGALLLTEIIARYPQSPYVPAAQALREQLIALAAAPAPNADRADDPGTPGPARSYSGLQVVREGARYDGYDYTWFGQPTYVYSDGVRVVYPGITWSPRHGGGHRHHDRDSGIRFRIKF